MEMEILQEYWAKSMPFPAPILIGAIRLRRGLLHWQDRFPHQSPQQAIIITSRAI